MYELFNRTCRHLPCSLLGVVVVVVLALKIKDVAMTTNVNTVSCIRLYWLQQCFCVWIGYMWWPSHLAHSVPTFDPHRLFFSFGACGCSLFTCCFGGRIISSRSLVVRLHMCALVWNAWFSQVSTEFYLLFCVLSRLCPAFWRLPASIAGLNKAKQCINDINNRIRIKI